MCLALAWVCTACTNGVPVRTPECNAKVNRCMEQCANEPTSQEPRNAGFYNPSGANSTSKPCESSCNHC